MIDHTGIWISASKFADVLDFYTKALKPLGYQKRAAHGNDQAIGFGDAVSRADWWVLSTGLMGPGAESAPAPLNSHHAFRVNDRPTVDAFYKAAIEAGGKDNGAPGLRPHYHANYYAAFVYDPAGNNIEVVCHNPQLFS